ncbi:hypothetical protein ACFU96_21290 [Streptomyces sp. NPDC057620]|uniref:hypothetical protein n=1 Tax=Streptomyces sp. NPDC057620 TaxID=3346185 RepID=UPI0036B6CF02
MSTQTFPPSLDIGRQLREITTSFQRWNAYCPGNQFREAAAAFRLLTARLQERQRAPYWIAQAPRRHRATAPAGRCSTAPRA